MRPVHIAGITVFVGAVLVASVVLPFSTRVPEVCIDCGRERARLHRKLFDYERVSRDRPGELTAWYERRIARPCSHFWAEAGGSKSMNAWGGEPPSLGGCTLTAIVEPMAWGLEFRMVLDRLEPLGLDVRVWEAIHVRDGKQRRRAGGAILELLRIMEAEIPDDDDAAIRTWFRTFEQEFLVGAPASNPSGASGTSSP